MRNFLRIKSDVKYFAKLHIIQGAFAASLYLNLLLSSFTGLAEAAQTLKRREERNSKKQRRSLESDPTLDSDSLEPNAVASFGRGKEEWMVWRAFTILKVCLICVYWQRGIGH